MGYSTTVISQSKLPSSIAAPLTFWKETVTVLAAETRAKPITNPAVRFADGDTATAPPTPAPVTVKVSMPCAPAATLAMLLV